MAKLFVFFRVIFAGTASERVIVLYRMAKILHKQKLGFLARILFKRIERGYGCYFHRDSTIGRRCKFPHPNGIVIGSGVVIGDDVTIYQQVTLGGARRGDYQKGNYPVVSNGVVIFAGAKVLGSVTLGKRAVVGANAVVTKSVPEDFVAVGVPARSFKNRGVFNE